MTQTLKVRSIVAAVLAPLVLAIGALVLVANQEPALQKLSVGGSGAAQERSAGDAGSNSGFATSAPMMAMPYGGANYVLDGDLPDLDDKAPAYRYVRQDGAAAAAKVAEALGLKGEPQQKESGWEVRDGSRTLVVNDFPGLPWFLSECFMSPNGGIANTDEARPEFSGCGLKAEPLPPVPAPTPDEAQVVPGTAGSSEPCPYKELPDGSVSDCGINILPGEPTTPYEPVRPEGLPDRQSAEASARSALDRLGVASQDLQLEDGFSAWYARAPMRIGGFEVQTITSVSIGVDGVIVGGNGMAGEPEHLGDYPLVSVQAGFERLQQGRFVGHLAMAGMARDLPAIAKAVPPPPSAAETTIPSLDCVPPPVCLPPSDDVAGITKEEFECRRFGAGPTDPPSPDVCSPVPPYEPPPYEPPVIKVTGAHIVLVQVDATLMPAYVFEVGTEFGGVTPPVPAVVDDLLTDFDPPLPTPGSPLPLTREPRG